ncbi:MAG: glycosyltransferase family 39 protein [Ferruginibacter sp.]|nr:glycosyltransferase family 39 protein [Ferruginibacter sp.]
MKKQSVLQVAGLCVVTYLLGIFCVPLMDVDATQYASMSREMLLQGNYLQLYDLGNDYLDKPPMLFWLSSAALYVFGIHDWAYRLPSFLFSLLAIYSTYRLALLFYKKEIALLSALVLASCQAMFLINHDVRTDTMLMGWVACSIWQLAEWYQYNKWKNLLLAAVTIAGGMMTKGPLALMIPVFAFVPHFILRRNWSAFVKWQYLPLLLVIAVLLIPMSIGLYQQFDLHPGKIVAGKKIDSGLRFFYWTQSFGRITGENTHRENASIFFQLQNMLWSFLPWILFLLIGLVSAVKTLIQKRFIVADNEEYITLCGFIFTYLALGSSKVQLPHYIFVVFPLAAIITANFLYRLLYSNQWRNWKKPLFVMHSFIFALLWIMLILLITLPFKNIPPYVGILAACCFAVFILLVFSKRLTVPKLLAICLFTTVGLNVFLNTAFYPALLQCQTGNIAAKFINDNKLPKQNVFFYGDVIKTRNSIYFYGDYFFKTISDTEQLSPGSYVLTSQKDYLELAKKKPGTIVFTGKGFPVTKLTFKFINPATREAELIPFYIVKIN